VGRDGFIISPDGRVSPCYLREQEWQKRGLDLWYARVDPDRGLEIDEGRLEELRKMVVDASSRCHQCLSRWHCAGGCRVHRESDTVRDAWCTMARGVTWWQLLTEAGEHTAAAAFLENLEVGEQVVELNGGPR
jgi:radical SAM protein with 4Fe4S-binding SPASM domain